MPAILIVEDDPHVMDIFQSFLTDRGYEVSACASTSAATAAIASDTPIDVAFVDYWLASETAEKVLKSLHANRPGVPVILITGGSKSVSVETTKWLGAMDGIQDFLQKPFSIHELQRMVDKFT